MIKWETCFNRSRLGEERQAAASDDRSEFEVDYDRIVFSYAFRRMQDKTQAIPLPESDFVHTRLTHSLEASCVGRSLGKIAGARIVRKYPELSGVVTPADFAAVVAAACLSHDIGNPPFGHSGENAIREYFLNGKGRRFEPEMTRHQWNDLVEFEGNASGFKQLTNINTITNGGLQLTYATLAAFTKYPRSSNKGATDRMGRASQKKYGFFHSERDIFDEVARKTGLIPLDELCWTRHPLAFLVEAADDICYRIIDLEDAARLELIAVEKAHAMLMELVGPGGFNEEKYARIPDKREQTGYLRAKAVFTLIYQVTEAFCDKEEDIRSGKFDEPLVKGIPSAQILEKIKEVSNDRIFNFLPVLKLEAAGFAVIGNLLDMFICAVNGIHGADKGKRRTLYHSAKLLEVLPSQFMNYGELPPENLYDRIMKVCEFVCGMTDSYAVSMYRKLTGTEIG